MLTSIRSKILLIIVAVLFLSTLLTVVFSRETVLKDMRKVQVRAAENVMRMVLLNIESEYHDLETYKEQALSFRKRNVRDSMRVFFGALDKFYFEYRSGRLTEEEAQRLALSFANQARFGAEDYFFVYDKSLINLAHPDPKMIGTDHSDKKDVKGFAYGPEMLRMVQNGEEGFLTMHWTRLGLDKPVPKLLYLKSYPSWGWLVGTGIYLDDLDREMDREREVIIQLLRRSLPRVEFGETGSLFIFDPDGRMIVPPADMPQGFAKSVNEDTGAPLLKDIMKLVGKGEKVISYSIRDAGGEVRHRDALVRWFQPLDWYVVAAVDQAKVERPARMLARQQMIISGTLSLATIAFIFWAVGRICSPLSKLADMASRIAHGDLLGAKKSVNEFPEFERLKARSEARAQAEGGDGEAAGTGNEKSGNKSAAGDETSRLLLIFSAMAENLNSLVGKVKRSGYLVREASDRIHQATHSIEASVEEQAASTRQVTETAQSISATAGDLARTMSSVSESANETEELADGSLGALSSMGDSMERLSVATEAISSRLSVISEKAGDINKIVTTISKVSEQTNLLSLNAAIEAEKAGEYGRGFSVVAREMRKLADQTALATLDIEKMVDDMQSAVSSRVMEMDKFGSEVDRGVRKVAEISRDITEVIGRVQSLGPRFASADQGMQDQSASATRISEAMRELQITVEATRDSLDSFLEAGDQLTSSIQEMEQEVANFIVDDETPGV